MTCYFYVCGAAVETVGRVELLEALLNAGDDSVAFGAIDSFTLRRNLKNR